MSPIHDQSYRRYGGSREPMGRAWSVIATTGIRSMLSRKLFLGVLVMAWVPVLVFTVRIWFAVSYPQAGQLFGVTPEMFRQFIDVQTIFMFFVTVYVGSGLIANDRRANALQIYLSKPLMRVEYIAGKVAVLATFLLFITLVPGILLVILQVSFSGSFAFIRNHPQVLPAVVLASLVYVVVASFAMLALSSLSKSARYVAIMYTGVIFFTSAMAGILIGITGSTRAAWVSIGMNLENLTRAMFREKPSYDTPLTMSVIILAGLVILSISILERRVRGVEVVK
jgi:ABC-type transport system involved in multi-copper enzyme maturation permease subunit